jgi:hypothetical protein
VEEDNADGCAEEGQTCIRGQFDRVLECETSGSLEQPPAVSAERHEGGIARHGSDD